MKRTRLSFLAQTQPGFEAIAADEITQTIDDALIHGTRTVADISRSHVATPDWKV